MSVQARIECQYYYLHGRCKDSTPKTAACIDCPIGEPPDTCCLTCDCEEETCSIGTLVKLHNVECIECHHQFQIAETPIMEGRTVPCPKCRLWHIIRLDENEKWKLRAIVPYVYKEGGS